MADSEALVDWDLAARIGSRLARGGPELSREQAHGVVQALREGAVEARAHVRAYTGLDAPAAAAPVHVVDRATWIRANARGMQWLLAPVESSLAGSAPGGLRRAGGALTGAEVGAALGWLSGKVLGQFDIYGDAPTGRLLLVAPNIAAAERELQVDHSDFRLWVCLHEETHRVQFTAVPWLRDHLIDEVRNLVGAVKDDVTSGRFSDRLGAAGDAIGRALRGQDGGSLVELLQGPEQRERVQRLTAVMSLLEGHADVVMDGVGPQVVPSVGEIRAAFQHRRMVASTRRGCSRRLLGLDAKLRQYRDGAAFVRTVVDSHGMLAFNRVWEKPAALPTPQEIADPHDWARRVLGAS